MIVPVDARTPDWPRKVADVVRDADKRLRALEGRFSGLGDYLDDAAASAGGVEIGDLYRNGSVLMVRVT